jgi:hypothetical protein
LTDERKLVALTYTDLRALGIKLTQRRLRTLIAEGSFPRGFQLVPGGRMHWVQSEVEDWLAEKAAHRKQPVAPPATGPTRRALPWQGGSSPKAPEPVRAPSGGVPRRPINGVQGRLVGRK